MSGVEKWVRRYHLERLANDAARLDNKLTVHIESPHCKSLESARLPDGKLLNLDDPAVSLFMQLVRQLNGLRVETPSALMKTMKLAFLGAGKIKIGSHFHIINPLFALRKELDGWKELDRLVAYVSGASMTDRARKLDQQFKYSSEDLATENEARFSIGIRFKDWQIDTVAFGSKLEYVLGFMDDVLNAAGAENHERCESGQVLIIEGGRKICVIPLQAKEVTAFYPDGVAKDYRDPSTMLYDWSNIDWQVRDHKLMNMLAQAAPEEARNLMKGRYLEDELGM